jgi:hypothetical protein
VTPPSQEPVSATAEAVGLAEELTKCWALLPTPEHKYPWRDMEEADQDARLLASAVDTLAAALARAERERDEAREALAAYRSALRSGEPESDRLRAHGDAALASPVAEGKGE